MKKRKISDTGFEVTGIGLGCMELSGFYGAVSAADAESTVVHAIELGINHFDTADVYGDGYVEELVGRTIKPYRNKVKIASKFGLLRNTEGKLAGVNNQIDYLKTSCDNSLKRLGIDQIDLYYIHRVDPNVPIEDTIGVMADLIKAGKIQYIGISGSSVEQLKRAHAVHPITAVQVEYSLWSREPERELLTTCEELEIGLVAYSPLGRGFLSGKIRTIDQLPANDPRRDLPRFSQEYFEANLKISDVVIEFAKQKSCTPAQVALAWLLAKSPRIAIIPGTKQKKNLEENVAAADIRLTSAEVEELDKLVPLGMAQGERYPERLMKLFNFKE